MNLIIIQWLHALQSRNVRSTIMIIFSIFLVYNSPLKAETFGVEHPVQIVTKNNSTGLKIFVKNKSICTVTLNFSNLQNAMANRKLPATIVVPPKTTIFSLYVHQINKRKKWNTYFLYNYMIGSMLAKHDYTAIYCFLMRKKVPSALIKAITDA